MKDPVRVAAGKKSKRKGSTFERGVAKELAAWWGGEFTRTPSSGGWGKSKFAREGFNASGDIVTSEADFPFCIECKAQEGWTLEHLLTCTDTCQTAKHWKQAVDETPPGKIPLLIFTKKFQSIFVMFHTGALTALLKRKEITHLCMNTPTNPQLWTTVLLLEDLVKIPKAEILETLIP